MHHSPDNCYHYICHVMDHYSKFHIIYPLKTKTAHEVAISLEERVLTHMGTWLNDVHMTAASKLLLSAHPHIAGLQDTV